MMFDPPDYPYKELSETYDPDDLLFNTDNVANRQLSILDTNKNTNGLAAVTNVDNQLSFHSNDSGKYFNVENTFSFQEPNSDSALNTELFVVQSDSLFSYEPNLLDENTVNQFLLPLQDSTGKSTPAEITTEEAKPDLLALHSCVMCHEIFTTEADLLDHTVSIHASDARDIDIDQTSEKTAAEMCNKFIEDNGSSNVDFESDWLVCRICQRVLATALEVEPAEQLCCIDVGGKSSVSTRKLSTMFVCDLCNGLFADGDALDTHRLTCYEDDQNYYDDHNDTLETSAKGPEICYSCDLCGKQYFSAEELKVHTLEGHRSTQSRTARRTYTSGGNNKMWNCGSCNQLFVTARELYRHKRGEDRPPGAPLMAYVCEECDKVLGSMCALHTHKKMHKVTKPGYPCRVCGRRFNQSGHLAIHMRMHTGERPYPCDLCSKAFKVKVERDDHRRTHTGERPFACSACPKTFTAAARLREHARIHTDQRPYRCEICGAAFRRPYARTVHTLIHTGEKPHECDVCGTAFRRSGDMWKHKRTLHGAQGGP